jgi:hypothetical protein
MTIGIAPPVGSGPALQDGQWLNALAAGQNRNFQNKLVAAAGGTKAAAIQLAAGVAMFGFATVANAGDSALLPAAVAGTIICVRNAGAQTLDLYGKGTDVINGTATATAYTLTADQAAIFFCVVTGHWSAVKSA